MKVSDLEGPMLDYWVARAIGVPATVVANGNLVAMTYSVPFDTGPTEDSGFGEPFYPSTRWGHGGPLIDRERIMLDGDLCLDATKPDGFEWGARIYGESTKMYGPTPLIAAMRALVASKFGEEVGDDRP